MGRMYIKWICYGDRGGKSGCILWCTALSTSDLIDAYKEDYIHINSTLQKYISQELRNRSDIPKEMKLEILLGDSND